MSKELEALESFYWILSEKSKYKYINSELEKYEIVKKALQRLEAIDNANPSEALNQYETMYDLALAYCEEHNPEIIRNVLETRNEHIKQALIKAQEQEKDKVFLKNLHNTKVKVPLVYIFNGLSQEKRFAYTEHIYYHWEEMKEALEAEIENIKTEKENLELKTREQGHVLEIIFEKNVDILDVEIYKDYEHYYRAKEDSILRKDWWLTQEEFDLLKRGVRKCQKNI